MAVAKAWVADQTKATETIAAEWSNIAAFVRDNLEVHDTDLDLGLFFGKVLGLRELEPVALRDVRTPAPYGRDKTNPLDLSFDVAVRLHVGIEKYVRPPSRILNPGEANTAESMFSAPPFGMTKQEELTVDKIAVVQARASVTDSGDYVNLECLSVAFPTSLASLL
jgi:hypothetical protein